MSAWIVGMHIAAVPALLCDIAAAQPVSPFQPLFWLAGRVRFGILAANCLTDAARIAKGGDAVLERIERILVRRFTEAVSHRLRIAGYVTKGSI